MNSKNIIKINGFEIIDATFQEELCYGTRVTFAIDKKENFCTIQKGYGSIGMDSIISSLNVCWCYLKLFIFQYEDTNSLKIDRLLKMLVKRF